MPFILAPEQTEIRTLFREYGQRVFTREAVQRWQMDQGLPDEVVQEFVELYFRATEAETNAGLIPGSVLTQTVIVEELSRCAGITLPFQNDLFELQVIAALAPMNNLSVFVEEFKRTGRVMFSLAFTEPQAGSDSTNITTNVATSNGAMALNGVKTFVCNGEYAPSILVSALDMDAEPDEFGAHPLSLWLVPRNLPGIKAVPINKIGQTMLPYAKVSFENVELQPEHRLSSNDAAFKRLFHIFETGRVFTCASSVGMAEAAMEDAVAYSDSRMAFGQPIGTFQMIAEKLTDMETRIINMRNLLYRGAQAIDTRDPERRLTVAMMKRYISRTATDVASDAMQILGGIGYTENERVSQIWKDCRGNQIAEGTDEIMVRIAAPLIQQRYRTR